MGILLDVARRVRTTVLGGARSISDPELFRKISLIAVLAWVGLGVDGLTSSCYGPEEAFLTLGGHVSLGVFIAVAAAATVLIISASYSQIIDVFPSGGGGYLVASKLLSPTAGMISGCALLIDYLLTIALSVAAGADALFSFLPARFLPLKVGVCVVAVFALMLLNLRGVRESVLSLAPIFAVFISLHVLAVVFAIASHPAELTALPRSAVADVGRSVRDVGVFGTMLLLLRAYSMGAGTYTGIEAVSNGLPILREPRVRTAKKTMRYMSASLAFLAAGLTVSYLLAGVQHEVGRTLNATLFTRLTGGWGALGAGLVTLALLSEATLLFAAAQTGFIDAPRVLAYMAADRWFPQQFSFLSERFVIKNGIILIGLAAVLLLVFTKGSVGFMVVLYSINVFITFSLSQLGMVRHWWQKRAGEKRWKRKLLVNGVGMLLTTTILIAVVLVKFGEGGWITVFVTGSLVAVAFTIKRFYARTQKQLRHLDSIVKAVESSRQADHRGNGAARRAPRYLPRSLTAVVLVNGFNGMGLHTLFSAVRLYQKDIRNFFFIQTGIVDAGSFKGRDELANLERHVRDDLGRYVSFVRGQGFHARGYPLLGTDAVQEICSLSDRIFAEHPNSIFFGGQIVFAEETYLSRLLYNYVTLAVQRELHHAGIPFVILPVPVSATLNVDARLSAARA